MPIDQLARKSIEDHELLCLERYKSIDQKLGFILKVLGVAGMLMVSALSWSLKAQWDAQKTAVEAIHQTSDETVRKLQSVRVDPLPPRH